MAQDENSKIKINLKSNATEKKLQENNEHLNTENLSKNPKKLNTKDAKIINAKDVEYNEENLCGDKSKKSKNYWYSKINVLGKPFYQMTRKDKAESYPYIIYYCNLHNTTVNSTLVDKNGKKIKIPKCNFRVYYEKNTESFYLETNHSIFCENRKKQNYQNLANINAEVSNYQQFRKDLIKYLEFNPVIKYNEFKIKANKLYYKNNCNFEIKDNTFKNIYYNWRKNSNVNTKYSVFKNSLTKNKKNLLRDYCYCLLYNHTWKKQIKHEHMIFCSDYFIKKLRA